MNDTLYSINGHIVPAEEAVIPVTDRGFLYGDGLFETLHAYGGKLFRVEEHLARLKSGAAKLFFEPAPDVAVLFNWLSAVMKAAGHEESHVRLTLTRGSGKHGPSLLGKFSPNVIIVATPYQRPPAEKTAQGSSAIFATFRRQETAATAKLKSLNYLEQILAKREADLAGVDEALLLNNAGMLCEGSASNISLIRAGVLTMPDPERAGALPGIAQLTAVRAAENLGIPVSITSLSPWDPGVSDEAFLTGSMREISPLVRIADKLIGTGKPGPVTLRLLAEYKRIVEKECAPFRFK